MAEAGDGPFFTQLGITEIVWLDDLFDAKAQLRDVAIAELVEIARASGTLQPHPKINGLTEDDSSQEWAAQLLAHLSQDELRDFLTKIDPNQESLSDYSSTEVQTVLSSLSDTIKCVGFDKWASDKQQLMETAKTGLFLVDREGHVDGDKVNLGDEIVKELLASCPNGVVVVLTHSVGPDGAEGLRNELANQLDVPVSKLGVVSKRFEAGLAKGIRAAVRVTLTQLTCANVTGRIVKAMIQSLENTASAMMRLPIQTLDHVVFKNSFDEGASEIDVIVRILTSRQRAELDALVAGAIEDVHSPIARMRKLRLLEALPALTSGDDSLLRQWRREEVFDVAQRVNGLRSPIACGDVFQKKGTKHYYVLLGPPCDLAVRPDGGRRADEGFLIKLKAPHKPSVGSEWRYFELPPLDGTEPSALDFRTWVSINLECVDWACFSADGSLKFSSSEAMPPGLLPGWEIRFQNARNKFRDGRTYCLSLGELAGKSAVAAKGVVEFRYQRVARLHAPRAAAAFAAFANFQARGAFEHDFAKGLGQDHAQSAPEQLTGGAPA